MTVFMKRTMLFLLLFIPYLLVNNVEAKTKKKNDTPAYELLSEYIRSLSSVYSIQQTANNDFEKLTTRPLENAFDKKNQTPDMQEMNQYLMNSIRSCTQLKLELFKSISSLQNMTLKRKGFEDIIPTTIYFYEEKNKLYDEIISLNKQLLEGPKPDVNISDILSRIPEITARIEYLDENIFKIVKMVLILLIDEKPDRNGHMSHLIITKEQKNQLIRTIDANFGESLKDENKNYTTVAAAALVKIVLNKEGYKCIDEWKTGK